MQYIPGRDVMWVVSVILANQSLVYFNDPNQTFSVLNLLFAQQVKERWARTYEWFFQTVAIVPELPIIFWGSGANWGSSGYFGEGMALF